MVVPQLIKIYEDRKHNLSTLLDNQKEDMNLYLQHQVYGAIQEIDNFIKILQEQHERQQQEISTLSTVQNIATKKL